jgi:tetratricopeptide (TPR) repeat protein
MNHSQRLMLTLARAHGGFQRRASNGWGPPVIWLVVVAVGLLALPAAANFAFDRVPDGTWAAAEVGDPHLAGVWSIEAVLAVVAAILAVRAVIQARRRIVVEGFADFTKNDKEAVEGLATLLIAELSRLRELYGRVNDELSTPMSVGAQGRGGAGRDTQAGAFLSVSADEVASTLNDAVATEATVSIGGFKIPIGFVLSVVGKIVRGPRIVGSLHDSDATGGPRLTAQLVGGKQAYQWRVDAAREAGVEVTDHAFLDPMINELASRIFTDLTLRSSVRWRAIRSFTEYLELYWESHRTPRDRGAKLERAEGKLLEAIAEDEGFDLAFYNLGVVYSQLADLEQEAAQRSEYVKPSDRPNAAYRARLDAALAAFNRAVALNRDRAEAIYALAVHEYTRSGTCDESELEAIVCRCERVLELDPHHAQAHDLMGIALVGLERLDESEASHRAAVAESWRRLREVERGERRTPPTVDSLVPGARSNLAAALRNLADVNHVAAQRGDRPLRRDARVDRLYALACELATGDTQAAMLSNYGQVLECRSNSEYALERYHAALKIDTDNPVYWARLAGACAASPEEDEAKARRFALNALGDLAPIYRRTLEAHHSHASVALRDATLSALRRTYDRLGDKPAVARIERLTGLAVELEDATKRRDVDLLLEIKARYDDDHAWEREQAQIALARTLGRLDRWPEAEAEYASLIELLERLRPAGIIQHSLHAKHARALRRLERRQEALVAAARGQLMDPLSASVRREVGKAHFALRQLDEALDSWKQTLWLTPNDPHLHWKVAFCSWSVAQDRRDAVARQAALREAADAFGQAATLFGVRNAEGWAWSQLWAGRVRRELGELDAAIAHLRSAAGCEPTAAAGALLLGELLEDVGDHDASRVQLERARTLLPAPTGDLVDDDWGEMLTDCEVVARATSGLARLADVGGDEGPEELRRAA